MAPRQSVTARGRPRERANQACQAASPGCDVCGSKSGRTLCAQEQMFGLSGHFHYFQCSDCGRLRLLNPPENLGEYYPFSYYSFSAPPGVEPSSFSPLRRWFAYRRNSAILFGKRGIVSVLVEFRPNAHAARLRPLISLFGLSDFNARILDVGCGSGQLLRSLALVGFRRLTGIDPFLGRSSTVLPGVRLKRAAIGELDDGPYDAIMFNHSLEHMPNHAEVFTKLVDLLHPRGSCLIRMPIAPSALLDQYGSNWVELDAPRHLGIHSLASVTRVAMRAGLKVTAVKYEESDFGFWASELYLRGLTLVDPATGRFRDPRQHFRPSELREFQARAFAANENQRGGRVVLVLRRAS